MIDNTMTAARQQQKPVVFCAGWVAGSDSGRRVDTGCTGGRDNLSVVVDRNTGLAIFGFDPVAYFTNRKAPIGRSTVEYARYLAVPPRGEPCRARGRSRLRFGGCDPPSRVGVAVAGDPRLWLIAGERLWLFYPERRAAFRADPGEVAANALENVPALERTRSP